MAHRLIITTRTAATLAALAALGAGCSSAQQDAPEATPGSSTSSASSAVEDEPAMDEDGGGQGEGERAPAPKAMELGEAAVSVGGQSYVQESVSGGELTLTPTSVAYVRAPDLQGRDLSWACVVVDADNTGAVPAAETAPIDSASWSVLLPDRTQVSVESLSEASGYADLSGGVIPAGIRKSEVQCFPLGEQKPPGQVRLMYLDGNYQPFMWNLPDADSGPQGAELAAHVAQQVQDDTE